MDLPNYRIIFILFLSFFFYSCESSIADNDALNSDFEISGFSVNYNNQNNQLSIYVEVSDFENINSIDANIKDGTNSIDILELFQSDLNPSVFLYEGNLNLSDEIYIYNLDLVINFINESEFLESYTFSTPIKPEIINYTIPSIFQLDATEWSLLPIDIEILNLNGFENIELVSYKVKRIYNGCDVECNYDSNCNDSIEDSEYQSDPTWVFEYENSYNINQNHLYHIDIPMRPLDGSELLDENGEIIFSSSDCGRTGTVLFEFTVIDQDGLIDQIIDIPLEITE
ncbi:hypothetical protein OAI93_01065 [bacterium]|jgi:hypothetical protein|nr:hypothetical protein [bacterium]